jgi:predicted translin family RNA/ssDNA-binding protein
MKGVYAPTIPTGQYIDDFKAIAAELDLRNEQRERIVKASRDTTYLSKKVIFGLHRIKETNRETTVAEGAAALSAIRDVLATRIAKELSADLYPLLQRSFSPGMQEYVEAAVFHAYLRDGSLVSRDMLSQEISAVCTATEGVYLDMYVDPADYFLGVADATGELMRLAVSAAGRGDTNICFEVRRFLNVLVGTMHGIKLCGYAGREMSFKMNVMRQSAEKVEAACFNAVMRRAEFGENVAPAAVAVEAAARYASSSSKKGSSGVRRADKGEDGGQGHEKRQRPQ